METHGFVSKNLIKNPSGHDQFRHWTLTGEGFDIESPPMDIAKLPRDDLHCRHDCDSAFVTSCDWVSMAQKIDLWEIGLNASVMSRLLPLYFKFSIMVGARFDCGGKFKIQASFQNSVGEQTLNMVTIEGAREKGDGWAEVTSLLIVDPSQREKLNSIRYFVLKVEGKDDQFWEPEFEIKFSRVDVTFHCSRPTERKLLRSLSALEYTPELNHEMDENSNLVTKEDGKDKVWKLFNVFKQRSNQSKN